MNRSWLCRIKYSAESAKDRLLKRDTSVTTKYGSQDIVVINEFVDKYCSEEKKLSGMTWEEVSDATIGVMERMKNGGSWEDEVKYIDSAFKRQCEERQQQLSSISLMIVHASHSEHDSKYSQLLSKGSKMPLYQTQHTFGRQKDRQ